MGVLIDTSVVIGIERRGGTVDELIGRTGDEPAFLSAVSASELLHGVHRADTEARRERRRAFVEAVLDRFGVLAFDLDVARVHARLWADLRAAGALIGPHDLIIAATALHHELPLLTVNAREFERVPGLAVRRCGPEGKQAT